MNAEMRMRNSLGHERKKPKHREYREPYSGPMVQRPMFAPRQMDVMRELVRGDGCNKNKEIGFRLGITEGTVKVYLHRLLKQLNLNSRAALALYVERNGMFCDWAELPSLVDRAAAAPN
jgi:DNA-binding NarL/FixJ family response regulator